MYLSHKYNLSDATEELWKIVHTDLSKLEWVISTTHNFAHNLPMMTLVQRCNVVVEHNAHKTIILKYTRPNRRVA